MKNDDALNKLEQDVVYLENKSEYLNRNREDLLVTHGWIGVGVGTAIIIWGGPDPFNPILTSALWKLLLGAVPLLGGVLLLSGLWLNRFLLLEAIGMTFLLIWDLWMVAGFTIVMLFYGYNTFYPLVIYGGFSRFMYVHLKTLYKFIDGD